MNFIKNYKKFAKFIKIFRSITKKIVNSYKKKSNNKIICNYKNNYNKKSNNRRRMNQNNNHSLFKVQVYPFKI